ncbi:MAG: hypothetical protein R6V75_10880 [Bacteroidales bacterium]
MNKKVLIISVLFLGALGLSAQNEQDALRYSMIQTGGTTRSLSMGGAFGAVGGDFSSLALNPAGLGIYRKGEFAFTGSLNSDKTTATYLGQKSSDLGYKMGFTHFGFVVPVSFRETNSGISGLNFAVGYNKLADFGQNITMRGINSNNSLVDEFVYSANHNSSWDPFSDGLAYETFLIEYDSLAGVYYSDFDGGNYGQTQRRTVDVGGGLGEYDFSISTNLSDRLYVGATLGIQKATYSETWEHAESDPNDVIYFFQDFTFRNTLRVNGTGYNLKLGILARPLDFLRVGAALHTPTFFTLSDDFRASMSTNLNSGSYSYEATGEFDYKITTPFRAIGSLALILNQYGLISVDYEYVDYASARLSSSDYDFFGENDAITTRYKAASNLRIGAEGHLANYFVRGGFAFYGSPYVDDEPNAGNNLTIWSAGVGYRDDRVYLDLGYALSSWEQTYFLYANNKGDLKNTKGRISATMGFRF